MTRMSREFSLVLLGAGVLTAGYFLWPDEVLAKRAEQQGKQRVGGTGTTHALLWVHAGGGSASSGRAASLAGVSRGGFGSVGSRVGGFGG